MTRPNPLFGEGKVKVTNKEKDILHAVTFSERHPKKPGIKSNFYNPNFSRNV
jgi:hypothetical protein